MARRTTNFWNPGVARRIARDPSDLFIKVCDTQIDAAWYETRKVCGCATKFKSPASVEAA
jgi:hypothetical protein